MSFIAAAAITAASVIGGSLIQSSGQKEAANTQSGMFNTIVGQEQPFLSAGQGATTTLNQLLGTAKGSPGGGLNNGYLLQPFNPTMSQLENYPGYQFQLQQGDLALNSANAPGVGAASGPALKSLMSFNQGLAASNYNNYFNQYQTQQNNIFNRLQQIASLGQNAAGNLGSSGAQLGTGIAQAQAGAAGSIGAGVVGAGNNIGQSIALNSLLSNPNAGAPSGWSTGGQTGDLNYSQQVAAGF